MWDQTISYVKSTDFVAHELKSTVLKPELILSYGGSGRDREGV